MDEAVKTCIGPRSAVKGEIKGDGSVEILGTLEGRIEVSADVEIGLDARVRAEIVCRDLVIHGQLESQAVIAERVTVQSSARVLGDLHAPRVRLLDGGRCRGRIDTITQREEVIDAILDSLNEGASLRLTGKPKWGGRHSSKEFA